MGPLQSRACAARSRTGSRRACRARAGAAARPGQRAGLGRARGFVAAGGGAHPRAGMPRARDIPGAVQRRRLGAPCFGGTASRSQRARRAGAGARRGPGRRGCRADRQRPPGCIAIRLGAFAGSDLRGPSGMGGASCAFLGARRVRQRARPEPPPARRLPVASVPPLVARLPARAGVAPPRSRCDRIALLREPGARRRSHARLARARVRMDRRPGARRRGARRAHARGLHRHRGRSRGPHARQPPARVRHAPGARVHHLARLLQYDRCCGHAIPAHRRCCTRRPGTRSPSPSRS